MSDLTIPAKNLDSADLIDVALQVHVRAQMYMTEALHTRAIECRDELVKRLVHEQMLADHNKLLIDDCERLTAERDAAQYATPQPVAHVEPVAWEDWRRVLAEKVDAYIQGEYEGEGAGDEAYADLKAHILKTPFATPQEAQDVQVEPERFDVWSKNPYTLALQKSISEDYEPKRPEQELSNTQLGSHLDYTAKVLGHTAPQINAERERDALRTFAKWVMESCPCGDVDMDGTEIDGGDLQDKAVELGLLKLTEPAPREPCGEGCNCSEYYSESEFRDGKVMCYRKTEMLTGEIK